MAITAASLMVKVGADVSQAQRALSQMGQTIDNTARRATSFRRQWDGAISGMSQGFMGGLAGGMGFGMITQGMTSAVGAIQGVVADAANAYMEYERLNMSLKAMSAQELVNAGSAKTFAEGLAMSGERAKELLEWTRELAISSPYSSSDVASALRLGMVYGFNSEQAKRSTKAVTDWGAAMGATGPEMERVIRALGQMNQRGKVSSQELMQLSEVGVGGLKILADAAGVSTAEMQKMIEQGLVPAGPAIEAIVANMESFDGAAAANAGTLGGLLSSMQDLKEIGEVELFGPIFQQIQPKLADMVAMMSTPEFREGLNALGTQLGGFTAEGIEAASGAISRTVDAIKPLLAQGAPPWLLAIQTLATAGDYSLKVNITPTVTSLQTPDGGLTVKVTAHAIDVTTAEGQTVKVTADWKEGTVGSAIAAFQAKTQEEENKILLNAGWHDGALTTLQTLIDATQLSAKVNPVFVLAETSTAVTLWTANAGKQLADGIGEAVKGFNWESYKQQWSDTLGTWQPALTGLSTVGANLASTIQGAFKEPIMMSGSWNNNTTTDLFGMIQGAFKEPIMMTGSWLANTLGDLWGAVQGWFTANPVNVTVNTTYSRNSSMTPQGMTPGYNPGVDITQPAPEAYIDPVTGEIRYRASGDAYFAGGLAVVGEQGPELVNLPQGARIYNNRDTKRLMAMGIPGFAEGNATPPAPGAWLGQSASFGAVGNLIGNAAGKQLEKAGKEFGRNVKEATNDFASSLRGVPGLFGTSQVTSQQMKMAEMGVPQNFADDYLRRLSDEVINGVNWDNVDIKDAAAAAGIDPNLPAQAILEMFKAAWQDSSLFANPENLKFINTDAVKAAQQRQQASESGKANIMALFGVGDEELVNQIAGLGIQVQTGLSQYLTEQGLGPVGAQVATGIGTGIAANGQVMGDGISSGFGTWITSPAGLLQTSDMGTALANATNAAYRAQVPNLDWTVPIGPIQNPNAPPAGAAGTTTPAFASGTLSSPAGWALVGEQGPELVRLPGGARVYNADETAARAVQVSVVINASVSQPHDIDLLARRVARAIQQKRG